MERHEEQREGMQPGGPQPDIAQKLAELDRVLAGVRDSLESLREAAVGGAGEPAPAEEAGRERAEPRPGDEPTAPAGAGREVGARPGGPASTAPEEGGAKGAEPGEEPGGKGATVALFEGSRDSMGAWKQVGAGECQFRDGQLQLRSGRDRGLTYYTERRFDDFRLRARYRLASPEAPITAAVRFLDPERPVPDREDPEKKYRYDNQAYVAAHTGFEVYLGTGGGDAPGTLAGIPAGDGPGQQRRGPAAELKHDDWNELDLEVRGNDYTVRLNGVETARFTNDDPWRGKPASAGSDAGFVGFVMGEQPRQAGHRPAPSPLAGPILPGQRGKGPRAGAEAPGEQAGAEYEVAFQRIEVERLGAAPQAPERDKRLARQDLAALHEQALGALARLKSKDKGLDELLRRAYGYAVLPSVGRASLLLGGARGYGEVFEQGKPIGYTRLTQVTFGVQVGGQTFTQLILFGSKRSLDAFKASPMAFNGNLSAVFIRGASGTTNFHDVTAHAYSRGGMLLEASLGGQKFQFIPAEQAAQELAKSRAKSRATEARAWVGQAGRAALGVAGKLTSKWSGARKPSASE
jgi:lipid-binding SYLF domain-containing protein